MEQNDNMIPTAPDLPEAPVVQPGIPVASDMFEPETTVANPEASAAIPEAPVVTPGMPATSGISDMFASETPIASEVPVVQEASAFQPEGLRATDALTMPEAPKAPDPIEEELKAPLKAAGPVPGSIGSAISVPSDGTNPNAVPVTGVQSVAFNDPLTRNAPKGKKSLKKQNNKNTTYILLGVLLAVVIVVILLMVFVFK